MTIKAIESVLEELEEKKLITSEDLVHNMLGMKGGRISGIKYKGNICRMLPAHR